MLMASEHKAQRLDCSLAINEWLMLEGLLVVEEEVNEVPPLTKPRLTAPKRSMKRKEIPRACLLQCAGT